MVVVLSAVAFILLITGLILVHEFGHYAVARWSGVEVEEFGFGLPPRALTLFRKWGTNFTLNWIPFGGFVRLKGENAVGQHTLDRGSFPSASILKRSLILLAGVAMNFLVALVIFLWGFSFGHWVPTYLSLEDMQDSADRGELTMVTGVLVAEVLEGGGAKDAGVAPEMLITAVDGNEVRSAEDVVRLQQGKRRVTYTMMSVEMLRGEQEGSTTATVAVEQGKTGVHLKTILLESSAPTRGPIAAAYLALREVKVVTVQTVYGIAQLFGSLASQGTVPQGVTGIVGIAQLTYSSVREGFGVYLRLVALLSLSLAVLNVLPFPALDGGRLIFVLSELFVRPGTRKVEAVTNAIGFVFLLAVIILVTFYDILRLFAS
jgi:regulator of sigma E protease